MYRVVNTIVDKIVEEHLSYDDALEMMHKLNEHTQNTLIARSWYRNIERELYKDISGNRFYGNFIIMIE